MYIICTYIPGPLAASRRCGRGRPCRRPWGCRASARPARRRGLPLARLEVNSFCLTAHPEFFSQVIASREREANLRSQGLPS